LCLSFGKAYKVSTVALRYFNVYGPRQALFNPYTGVIAIFCSRLLNDKPPLIYEDGLQTRDFVHVQDIIQANLKVMESEEANYRVFNVGTGRAVSIKEMSDILRRLMGKEDIQPHITGVYRKGDIRHCIADITLLREVVGYKPTVQVEEGLKDVVAWSRGQLAEDRLDVAVQALEERCLQQCDVIPGGLPNVSQ
jgi:dTDP-L-rhamnose 4-epimerase